jgi:hypothetical protein
MTVAGGNGSNPPVGPMQEQSFTVPRADPRECRLLGGIESGHVQGRKLRSAWHAAPQVDGKGQVARPDHPG